MASERRHLIDRILALIAFVPVGLDRLVHAAIPALRARSMVVPVALGLLVLVAVPVTQAGFELVINRTVPSEVIERDVGSATMLQVAGHAYDTGLSAGTDAQGRALRWLALRDGPDPRSMLLVRTPEPTASLRTRVVTARVATDGDLVARINDALEQRGAPGTGTAAVTALDGRYLVEAPDAVDAREIDDPAAIASLADGTPVRLELRLTGEGIAPCTLDAACDARETAAGQGTWLQRATGAASRQAVLVETAYPPSVIPVDLVGEQVREAPTVEALLETRPARVQIGWGRTLRAAIVEHDPSLPLERAWLGVIALAAVAALLLLARRLAYPIFRHEAGAARWTRPVAASTVAGRALGHLAVGDGPSIDAQDVRLDITPGEPGDVPRVEAGLPGGRVPLEVPAAGAGVSGMEHGRLAWVGHSRPALWLHWYRTDLRVAFETAADRDAAATMLSSISDRPAPPPKAPTSPQPPRRRPPGAEPDEPAPTWRRPRPRGAR